MLPTDVKTLQRVAEGSYAASALDYLSDVLNKLVEDTLGNVDALRQKHQLTPEIAFATLHEIGAYRAIRNRLTSNIRRAENEKRAAASRAPTDDGNSAIEEFN